MYYVQNEDENDNTLLVRNNSTQKTMGQHLLNAATKGHLCGIISFAPPGLSPVSPPAFCPRRLTLVDCIHKAPIATNFSLGQVGHEELWPGVTGTEEKEAEMFIPRLPPEGVAFCHLGPHPRSHPIRLPLFHCSLPTSSYILSISSLLCPKESNDPCCCEVRTMQCLLWFPHILPTPGKQSLYKLSLN